MVLISYAPQPLNVIMDIFGLFSNVKDYTSELNKAPYCSPSPIAFGGFSEVYQATLGHGAQVAVKCVKSSISSDYEAAKVSQTHPPAKADLTHPFNHPSTLPVSWTLGRSLDMQTFSNYLEWLYSTAGWQRSQTGWSKAALLHS